MSYAFVRPNYGRSTLADVLPAIASHIAPDWADAVDVLGLPHVKRYVLVLVDGLGYELLHNSRDRVPYLGSLLPSARKLTCALPSTTATSLTTLGTGVTPGQHGIAGYTFRLAGENVNPLIWNTDLEPKKVQTRKTWFEKMASSGVAVSNVSIDHFVDSGLTGCAQRGAKFWGYIDDEPRDERIEMAVSAVAEGQRSFVYLYERELDHTGHGYGCVSVEWRQVLDQIDEYLESLRNALPADVCLMVTGDHGMVDVPERHQIVIEDIPGLTSEVDMVAGEGRMRQLYTDYPSDVAARWAKALGDRAEVYTKQEAIEDGWFGEVAPNVSDRIGDVLVAAKYDYSLMTLAQPREFNLVGQHGSLTSAEMMVPLLIDEG
ncbi:alkaline phosphatase family protein [Propionimicrobium lymphophilum]|uniref:alkaline phosphatase family protein n=1 Tax=Propionimicrobium lymphophilum TaxID=33012 RepID=UPI00288C1359|nr:alkaline phosphatase family protein [Propionimicrobium lymphophilum]